MSRWCHSDSDRCPNVLFIYVSSEVHSIYAWCGAETSCANLWKSVAFGEILNHTELLRRLTFSCPSGKWAILRNKRRENRHPRSTLPPAIPRSMNRIVAMISEPTPFSQARQVLVDPPQEKLASNGIAQMGDVTVSIFVLFVGAVSCA